MVTEPLQHGLLTTRELRHLLEELEDLLLLYLLLLATLLCRCRRSKGLLQLIEGVVHRGDLHISNLYVILDDLEDLHIHRSLLGLGGWGRGLVGWRDHNVLDFLDDCVSLHFVHLDIVCTPLKGYKHETQGDEQPHQEVRALVFLKVSTLSLLDLTVLDVHVIAHTTCKL